MLQDQTERYSGLLGVAWSLHASNCLKSVSIVGISPSNTETDIMLLGQLPTCCCHQRYTVVMVHFDLVRGEQGVSIQLTPYDVPRETPLPSALTICYQLVNQHRSLTNKLSAQPPTVIKSRSNHQ